MAHRARLAETLLRLGCSLVGWMVVYAHCIWLATLRVVGCEADGDELWRLLLGFMPFTLGFAFLLGAVARLSEVARTLRWLALPLVALVPLAAVPVYQAVSASTFGGQPICLPATDWHAWWGPLQAATLGVVGWRAYRAWSAA